MPGDGLEYEFTTAPIWESGEAQRRPRRPWRSAVAAGVFLACLAIIVIIHGSKTPTDPISPDFSVASR